MTTRHLFKEIVNTLKEAGIAGADLDARILLKQVLQIDDTDFFKTLDQSITDKKVSKIKELTQRRAQNEPMAYIIGKKEFFGLDFFVDKNCLIPRPETEWLVEKSIKYLESSIKYKKKINIIDIGTGSGNIIISITKVLTKLDKLSNFVNYYAVDNSELALERAIKNARYHGLDKKITFLESDLLSSNTLPEKFDLIIANLPYVPEENPDESVNFEPKSAIFTGDNGTEIIKQFLAESKDYLNTNGRILIELDPRNAKEIKNYTKTIYPKAKIWLRKDLSGLNRYLLINQKTPLVIQSIR